MSLETVSYDLAAVYERAARSVPPSDVSAVRRAFRRALRAASERGDLAPAILLSYRWA